MTHAALMQMLLLIYYKMIGCFISLGVEASKKSTGGCTAFDASFSHQFRPIAFALGNTKNGFVYKMLYGLTCDFLQWPYDFKWSVSAMCQDHSEAGGKAAIETWSPSCLIILCWPHIKLNAVKNNKKLLRDRSLADLANQQITYVHCSRTTQQFEQLLKLMLQHWRDVLVENDFADWFAAE